MPQIMRERNEAKKARCKKIVHDMDIVNSVRERFTISQLRLLFACMDRVTPYRMWIIYEAFEDGLNVDQVKLISNPDLDDTQASVIKQSLLDGLCETYTKMIATGKIPYGSMEHLSRYLLHFQRLCNSNSHISDPVVMIIDPDYDNGIYDYIPIMTFIADNNGKKEIWIFDKYSDSIYVSLEEYKQSLTEDDISKYDEVVLDTIKTIEEVYYSKLI